MDLSQPFQNSRIQAAIQTITPGMLEILEIVDTLGNILEHQNIGFYIDYYPEHTIDTRNIRYTRQYSRIQYIGYYAKDTRNS